MEQILEFGQVYSEWIIMGIALFQLIIMFLLIHKITAIRKLLKRITNQVEEYVAAVMESEEESVLKSEENRRASEKEAQTQLISSVLEEIFP